MRLLIERSELLRVLGHVTSVVERRTTVPLLSNVLLRATPGNLALKGTDLEREVIETAAADVEQPGATTVSAHMIHDIVRKLPDGMQVVLDTGGADGKRLTVSAGSSRFFLPVLPGDEFPDLSAGAMPHEFELPARDVKRLIEKTRFAISTEETRYYLNGIYMHVHAAGGGEGGPPMLRAVATDGHRLALVELPAPAGSEDMPGVIVPRKTVHELHRLIEDSDTPLTVALSPSKVQFRIGTVVMTSKLIDGSFPDYQRVIPQGNNKVLNVANADFATAVDRVSTVSTDRGRAVKLNIEQERLTLTVTNPDGGSATEEVVVDYNADPLEIGFNARYLLDISSQLESDTVHFFFADPGSPTTVRDGDDRSALYVLMPMRV
ncbi:MAG: DNA polymerase III subunit beta [Hyphomicrobiaceae bacterium]